MKLWHCGSKCGSDIFYFISAFLNLIKVFASIFHRILSICKKFGALQDRVRFSNNRRFDGSSTSLDHICLISTNSTCPYQWFVVKLKYTIIIKSCCHDELVNLIPPFYLKRCALRGFLGVAVVHVPYCTVNAAVLYGTLRYGIRIKGHLWKCVHYSIYNVRYWYVTCASTSCPVTWFQNTCTVRSTKYYDTVRVENKTQIAPKIEPRQI